MSSDQSPQPAPSQSNSWLILLILIAPAILTMNSVAGAAFSFLSFSLCFVGCLAGAAIHNH